MNDDKNKNSISIPMAELVPIIVENIASGSGAWVTIRGNSMYPFLSDGRDKAFFTAVPERIRRGDIILYKRHSGQYVMHRVYSVDSDGVMSIVGDYQTVTEDGIKREQVVAYVSSVERNGKIIDCLGGRWRRRMTVFMRLRIKHPAFAHKVYLFCVYSLKAFREPSSIFRRIRKTLGGR